ncbi:DUF4118 domain-containing protein [Emergencia timonensis]|uniref:DUF4118 domain-containing protein n=1 Tax=Emergencia timonensis TaxID=1776384 RepID=UPI00399200EA
MEEIRVNPDKLLETIRREDEKQQSGHLKIFFGYAAGVGKTYTMLKAAQAAKNRGIDVIAGYVEPHARPETLELMKGLESLPTLEIKHKNMTLREFDLDQALARNPQLILVDELAHTNADGCRHEKRYKDIEELLKAGIDVYTTVNVQHIESLNDLVAAITGVSVQERIPDSVFDEADQVELVDIEPEDLINRLNAGKIYRDEQAQRALINFFSIENLTSLREIALRRCADRMNKLAERVRNVTNAEYYNDEHILVCLSASPSNKKIIRTAARMASAFKGTLTALFVETPGFSAVNEEDKKRLRDHIRLATQLGAKVETVYGDDISLQIAEFARLSGVSKIVMGRYSAKKKYLFSKQTLTDKLIEAAPGLEIYVIPDKDAPYYKPQRPARRSGKFILPDTLKSLAILAASTLLGFAFYDMGFSEANIIMIYILGVVFTSLFTSSKGYSLVSSVVSVLIFNFFFTNPRFTFTAYDNGYPVTFLVMLITAFITSTLVVKLKQYARQAVRTAYHTKILLETNQMLQSNKPRREIVEIISTQLTKLLKRDIVFYLAGEEKLGEPVAFLAEDSDDEEDKSFLSDNEKAVAAWTFKNNKHAGATTDTLSSAKCLYLAVRINSKVYGVVGIAIDGKPLDPFENNITLSILGECAMALENERVMREKAEADLLAKNEKLRANLLRSISHDLRTPLTSISGNAGILMTNYHTICEEKKLTLYTAIYDDSMWLINLVENLLSVTRLEDGSMQLNTNAELIDEVIDEALQHIDRKSVLHKITVNRPDEFLMAKMDARLIIQVIINVVDNAIKYTPEGSEIDITTAKSGGDIVVSIADNGKGIADDAKKRIFDMFYTANMEIADSHRSLGLGLALCKSIINAHDGEITVLDNKPKGAIFRFTLPAEEVTLHE